MTDPAVESTRQVQLTFQDKSKDANLEAEVTRESWLNEVQSQIEAANETPVQQEMIPAEVSEDFMGGDFIDSPTDITLAPIDKNSEVGKAIPSISHSVLPHLDFEAEPEEMDFSTEPLPEPMGLASEKVVANLGSLTLPAALCDDELLAELASIPEKMGFKIGEVAEMLGIKQYVLRYWETEFDVLKPKKAANNQRYYTKKDVENVYLIRKLLHRDRFSIEGARAALKDLKHVVKKEKDWNQVNHRVESLHERVDHLIVDLRKLRQLFAD